MKIIPVYVYILSYVVGISKSLTAGSFIRPSRPDDRASGFFEALEKKYALGHAINDQAISEGEIRISGKTVKEVGFAKIRQQLANIQELQIVILDGLCITGLRDTGSPALLATDSEGRPNLRSHNINSHDLKISELDLSRNLLETWADVLDICTPLKFLRSLDVK